MDLWSKAEQGLSAPLISSSPDAAAPSQQAAAKATNGGGDVGKMVAELHSLVRRLKADHDSAGARGARRPSRSAPEDLEPAYVLVSSIQACLRPPAPATMTRNEQRDFRSAVAALEALRRAAEGPDRSAASSSRAAAADDEKEEASAAPQQQQTRALEMERETDSFERMLEEERQRDIESISQRVSTVNQIYRDIADLVSTQQEDVDSIEAQIDTAHSRTTKAQTQLEKANAKRKAKVKCCFYFAVALACFGTILIIAIIGFKNIAKYAA